MWQPAGDLPPPPCPRAHRPARRPAGSRPPAPRCAPTGRVGLGQPPSHRSASSYTGTNCHTACARSHIAHPLGALGEAGPRSEPRDAVVIRPQQLPHRRQFAAARSPAHSVGRHPRLDPAEHDRAVGLGTEEAASTLETGLLEMGEQLQDRPRGLGSWTPLRVADPGELCDAAGQRFRRWAGSGLFRTRRITRAH